MDQEHLVHPNKDMFTVKPVVEQVLLKLLFGSCLDEGGDVPSHGLVLDMMQAKSSMLVGAVEDHFLRLDKHILVEPRFARTCHLLDITCSQLHTLCSEPDFG